MASCQNLFLQDLKIILQFLTVPELLYNHEGGIKKGRSTLLSLTIIELGILFNNSPHCICVRNRSVALCWLYTSSNYLLINGSWFLNPANAWRTHTHAFDGIFHNRFALLKVSQRHSDQQVHNTVILQVNWNGAVEPVRFVGRRPNLRFHERTIRLYLNNDRKRKQVYCYHKKRSEEFLWGTGQVNVLCLLCVLLFFVFFIIISLST